MKSIRANPTNGAPEGDERIRTAVCEPSTDPMYVRRFHAGAQSERVAAWEQANLCCFCGHDLAAHVEGGCDYEIRDYGETDCLCSRYVEARDA